MVNVKRKNPHVCITGRWEDVQDAGLQIRHELHQCNRITMKMDISWTSHSHIIGKKGKTIQGVAKRTGVSIHFPDMNKNSLEFKSNHVSINARGDDICGLEDCRSSLRLFMPINFTFILPPTARVCPKHLDTNILMLVKNSIQTTYAVQVDLEVDAEGFLIGSVKGNEWDSDRVIDATLNILRQFCGDLCKQIPVELNMEISSQQHTFVFGKWKKHLRPIMQQTATIIKIPDFNDESIPQPKKSTVIISGAIRNVYRAKQMLTGCLPLVLLFELMPDHTIDREGLLQVAQSLDIYVVVKEIKTDGRRPIVLKTYERNASNLYEAWRFITKSHSQLPDVKVPADYHLDQVPVYEYNHLPTYVHNKVQQNNGESYQICRLPVIPDKKETVSQCMENVITRTDLDQMPELMSKLDIEGDAFKGLLTSMDRRAPGCEKKVVEQYSTSLFSASDYFNKRSRATEAMKNTITPVTRFPTSCWSGYGFSKSMPGPMFEQLKRQEQSDGNCNNIFNERVSPPSSYYSSTEDYKYPNDAPHVVYNSASPSSSFEAEIGAGFLQQFSNPAQPHVNLSASNYIESVPRRSIISNNNRPVSILSVLKSLQMEQYYDIFSMNDIDLDTFVKLSEQHLKQLGIGSFGHRRTLMCGIKDLKSPKPNYSYINAV